MDDEFMLGQLGIIVTIFPADPAQPRGPIVGPIAADAIAAPRCSPVQENWATIAETDETPLTALFVPH
jgi:hypothetical protein